MVRLPFRLSFLLASVWTMGWCTLTYGWEQEHPTFNDTASNSFTNKNPIFRSSDEKSSNFKCDCTQDDCSIPIPEASFKCPTGMKFCCFSNLQKEFKQIVGSSSSNVSNFENVPFESTDFRCPCVELGSCALENMDFSFGTQCPVGQIRCCNPNKPSQSRINDETKAQKVFAVASEKMVDSSTEIEIEVKSQKAAPQEILELAIPENEKHQSMTFEDYDSKLLNDTRNDANEIIIRGFTTVRIPDRNFQLPSSVERPRLQNQLHPNVVFERDFRPITEKGSNEENHPTVKQTTEKKHSDVFVAQSEDFKGFVPRAPVPLPNLERSTLDQWKQQQSYIFHSKNNKESDKVSKEESSSYHNEDRQPIPLDTFAIPYAKNIHKDFVPFFSSLPEVPTKSDLKVHAVPDSLESYPKFPPSAPSVITESNEKVYETEAKPNYQQFFPQQLTDQHSNGNQLKKFTAHVHPKNILPFHYYPKISGSLHPPKIAEQIKVPLYAPTDIDKLRHVQDSRIVHESLHSPPNRSFVPLPQPYRPLLIPIPPKHLKVPPSNLRRHLGRPAEIKGQNFPLLTLSPYLVPPKSYPQPPISNKLHMSMMPGIILRPLPLPARNYPNNFRPISFPSSEKRMYLEKEHSLSNYNKSAKKNLGLIERWFG